MNAVDDLDQELLAGVDDIIARPIQPAELAIQVRRQLPGGGRAKQRIRIPGTHYGSKTPSVHPVGDDQWYHGLFVNHHIVMLLLDPASGAILDANPAACNYYGWNRKAFLRLNISEINTLPVEKFREQILETGQLRLTYYDFHHRLVSGTIRDVRVYSRPIRLGKREALYSLVFDITEQRQAEEALRQERSFSSVIIDSLPGVFYLYDENRRFLRWNMDFERVTGYTAAEIQQMCPLDFFAANEKELLAKRIDEVFDRSASSVEANFATKDGHQIPYFFTGRKVVFDGRTCLLGVGVDITERKLAEEQVQASELRFRCFFENSMDAILFAYPDGRIASANPAAEAMFGMSEEEIIQVGRTGLVDPKDTRLSDLLTRRKRDGKTVGELTLVRADGTRFEAELSTALYHDAEGLARSSMIIRDITERKRAESIIQEKERFISGIVETTPAIVYVYDMQRNRNVYSNTGLQRLLGY